MTQQSDCITEVKTNPFSWLKQKVKSKVECQVSCLFPKTDTLRTCLIPGAHSAKPSWLLQVPAVGGSALCPAPDNLADSKPPSFERLGRSRDSQYTGTWHLLLLASAVGLRDWPHCCWVEPS